MNLQAYIVLDRDNEIIAYFADFDEAVNEFYDNPVAARLVHADCVVVDKQLLMSKRGET